MKNNNKLNLLFISIAFPPKSDPECLQTAKYFKYLVKDKNLNIDVVTSEDKTLFMPIDKNLKKYVKGYRQIIKVSFFENKYINFLIRKINPFALNYPDSKFLFYKKYKSVIKQLKMKPDIIYSRSFPLSSTLMAYYVQKELQVPWVLHLSDPWTLSPIHKLGDAKEWNDKMEEKCFNKATILSFTSKKTIELYSKKYPKYKNKMIFFPNVFDLDDKIDNPYTIQSKIKIVYTGGLIDNRSPQYIFNVIKKLYNEYPEIISNFKFIFAGDLDRKNKILFKQNIPFVEHIGLLSFKESLKLQQSADLLLVIDTPFQNNKNAIFFPSKLLDYMLIQRKILALTNKNSTTWDIVNNKLGNCYEHNDVDGIVQYLITTWKAWKNKDKKHFYNKELDISFSANKNATKLSKLFQNIELDNNI